jgi:hypothetical protein
MRTWAIASLATIAVLGGATTAAAQPADRPHVGRCHAKVDKPEIHSKGPDSGYRRGGNDRSITSGVTVHCTPDRHR